MHGLVVSSGELKVIDQKAFQGLVSPLQALGLPNNQLQSVPTEALNSLPELDRLDLSGNVMKILDGGSFKVQYGLEIVTQCIRNLIQFNKLKLCQIYLVSNSICADDEYLFEFGCNRFTNKLIAALVKSV